MAVFLSDLSRDNANMGRLMGSGVQLSISRTEDCEVNYKVIIKYFVSHFDAASTYLFTKYSLWMQIQVVGGEFLNITFLHAYQCGAQAAQVGWCALAWWKYLLYCRLQRWRWQSGRTRHACCATATFIFGIMMQTHTATARTDNTTASGIIAVNASWTADAARLSSAWNLSIWWG